MRILPVIVGPTASGKTRLAVEIALRCGGEVISADSMQIYRGMDIGTAKPSAAEMRGVPHHMIDIVDPADSFSVAQYKARACSAADAVLAAGRVPLIAGGTGLYINAVVHNIAFPESPPDSAAVRAALQAELAAYAGDEAGPAALHARLAAVDPAAAARLHPNDVKRVIRALEVFQTTGSTISSRIDESRMTPPPYEFVIIGLNVERGLLRERIDRRVDEMIGAGLEAEVRTLLESGVDPGAMSMQGLGYKQMIPVINGGATLAEAAEEIKLRTRQYAKRQFTWFRKLESVNWIDIGADTTFEEILTESLSLLAKYSIIM